MELFIFDHYCEKCRKVTKNIAYKQNETQFSYNFRYICLDMCCNHRYTIHFTKRNWKEMK